MAMSRCCPECGEVIGMRECGSLPTKNAHLFFTCPGKGNHKEVNVTRQTVFFGHLEKVTVFFPETYDISTWYEYVGPKKRGIVKLVMMFGPKDSLLIDGEWCFYKPELGLWGDGAAKLS